MPIPNDGQSEPDPQTELKRPSIGEAERLCQTLSAYRKGYEVNEFSARGQPHSLNAIDTARTRGTTQANRRSLSDWVVRRTL